MEGLRNVRELSIKIDGRSPLCGANTSNEENAMSQTISRRAVLSTTGRAAVATLGLGGVSVAAGLPAIGKSSDDPLIIAVEAHRRLREHVEAFSDATPIEAMSSMTDEEIQAYEAEFEDLCEEAAVDSWRLLKIEATSIAGVAAFLDMVSHYAFQDLFPDRETDEGKYVAFEADAIAFAARSLTRLTGGQANG
jgi:hypothetical protein